MTAILACHVDNVVYMVADKLLSGGIPSLGGRKLVRYGDLLVGFAGPGVVQNLLEFQPVLQSCDLSPESLSALLVELRKACADKLFADLLLARGNKIVYMGNHAGWYVHTALFPHGIGSGGRIAMGSWMEQSDLTPEARLRRAIATTAKVLPDQVSPDCDLDHT